MRTQTYARSIGATLALLAFAPALQAVDVYETVKFEPVNPAATLEGEDFGFAVAADGRGFYMGAPFDFSSGVETGRVHVVATDAGVWSSLQSLVHSGAVRWDSFGVAMAIDGDDLLVGAHKTDATRPQSGSAYVYRYLDGTWSDEQALVASDPGHSDAFGSAVDLDGDYLIVGAPGDDANGADSTSNEIGSAYVFHRSGTAWSEQDKLLASDGANDDAFGVSVAISGDYAVMGAPGDDASRGCVYIFKRDGAVWNELDKLQAADGLAGDRFGAAVQIDGDTLTIGAPGASSDAGRVYVYKRTALVFTLQDVLTPEDADAGDAFGSALALAGDALAIGAPEADAGAGLAYLFERSGTVWYQLARYLASDAEVGDQLGASVAIGESFVLVGAPEEGLDPGSAYAFTAVQLDCDDNGIPDHCDVSCTAVNPLTGHLCIQDFAPTVCGAQGDCDGNLVPDTCDLDCNSNGLPDACDLSGGGSADCDSNGVPDECDPDCDNNGVADACDVAAGGVADCDADGVPDSCELHERRVLMDQDFTNGLPLGWTATGLWHATDQCAAPSACGASQWAYFGQDAACDFDTGSAEAGALTSAPVSIPVDAVNVTLTYCSRYDGEGGVATSGVDAAWVEVDGVVVDDAGTTGVQGSWETRTVDLSAYAGQNVTVQWRFSSRDAIVNDTLGWQITQIELVSINGSELNDCNGNGVLDSCDLASGLSQDCNANSKPDECDIAAGTSEDCNANNVPDTCESAADCNGNGIQDICEIEVVYVRKAASGLNDGSTWADAFTDLQDALAYADTVCTGAELWIAAGAYAPAGAGGARTATFTLREGVALYGGFVGNETARDQRNIDPTLNGTVLSGDLNGNDQPAGGRADNAYHVVSGDEVGAGVVLDGFTIRGGTADGSFPEDRGSALYLIDFDPTVRHCRFTDNHGGAGAVYLKRSSPTIDRCLFDANTAHHGAALYVFSQCAPRVLNCAFVGNAVVDAGNGYGGAVRSFASSPVFANCAFTGNTADSIGGAAHFQTAGSDVVMVNCTVSRNSAGALGGGVAVEIGASLSIENSILWGNDVGGLIDETAQLHVEASASATVDYSCIDGLTGGLGGTGNLGADPLFSDADGADNLVGTIDDNLRPGAGSPAIDAGANDAYDLGAYGGADLAGLPRFLDDPDATDAGSGIVPLVDLGAFERQTDCNVNGIADAIDIAAGTSVDCTGNTFPDECEPDCDTNGLADSCEIDSGVLADCDHNGVPDICQVAGGADDCNTNGVPDACDIVGATSTDCDVSGMPDECKADCNANGVPDGCEDFAPVDELSPKLSPVASVAPRTYVLDAQKWALGDVTLTFDAVADLEDNTFEYVTIAINGNVVGDVFLEGRGESCPLPSHDEIVLTATQFNAAVGAFPAVITMTPSTDVTNICTPTSYITVRVSFEAAGDCDANGVPDSCDIDQGGATDANGNGVPDNCEDCNSNGVPDEMDIAGGASLDLNANGRPDECEDCNNNGTPDDADIAAGTSADANANQLPDECEDCNANGTFDDADIAAATSADCNDNDIPDECEIDAASPAPGGPFFCTARCAIDCDDDGVIDECALVTGAADDCNANAIPDACDIAAGTSPDCNTNGVPDGCAAEVDSDGDGALDDCEGCPNDEDKTEPGLCGCGETDDDTDGDGVVDCLDACPGTPAQQPVDTNGCPLYGACCFPGVTCLDSSSAITEAWCLGQGGNYLGNGADCDLDSDGDLSPDCDEDCPGDPFKTEPGVCGCGVADDDLDGDGVYGCFDLCLDTPPGDAVDSNGCSLYGACCLGGSTCFDDNTALDQTFCETTLSGVYQGNGSWCDADGDLVNICLDGCPDDPLKTEPGVCGCGSVDADADVDGVADCVDACPATPSGYTVAGNGCGTHGACCLPAGGCADFDPQIDEAYCESTLGGAYQGDESTCVGNCQWGDYDGDGDVDLDDHAAFVACQSVPVGGLGFITPTGLCLASFDFDGDGDVDLHDYAELTRMMAGG